MNKINTDKNNEKPDQPDQPDKTYKIAFMVIITGRKNKNAILSAISEAGARIGNVVYCRGTVDASVLLKSMGLVPERENLMITCVLPYSKADSVMQILIEKFNFDKPNTGIAFTIPINRFVF